MEKEVVNEKVVYHIKPYLRQRGFNLSALANSMGMSFQRFDHHIKPKDDLSFNFVLKLSNCLNLTMDEFINEVTIIKEL